MSTVNIVTEDRVVVVGGEAINADFIFPSNLWAIQWDGLQGHAEWTDGPNTELTAADVDTYVTQWTDAKAAEEAVEDAEVLAESLRVKTYIELRTAAYPDMEEQLDMQYWDTINGTSTWLDLVTSIKTTYPKGA